ncbi:MAG: BrnT family toxin [Candidatus Binatia bacterium]|nr:BrnT family toxin [Candidatus Binatia bacterium]
MRRIEIEWDEDSISHIWRHHVEPEEVEETLEGRYIFRRGRDGTYYIFGQSKSGRYLFIVLAREPSGRYRVVTARDMTEPERRWFRRKVR